MKRRKYPASLSVFSFIPPLARTTVQGLWCFNFFFYQGVSLNFPLLWAIASFPSRGPGSWPMNKKHTRNTPNHSLWRLSGSHDNTSSCVTLPQFRLKIPLTKILEKSKDGLWTCCVRPSCDLGGKQETVSESAYRWLMVGVIEQPPIPCSIHYGNPSSPIFCTTNWIVRWRCSIFNFKF